MKSLRSVIAVSITAKTSKVLRAISTQYDSGIDFIFSCSISQPITMLIPISRLQPSDRLLVQNFTVIPVFSTARRAEDTDYVSFSFTHALFPASSL